jgi:hypothetical protein
MPLKPEARTQAVKLTAGEQSALMDRLDMPENIAEALTDAPDGEQPPVPESHEIVAIRAATLARIIGGDARTIPENLGELDCAIIVEALEGSTYLASLDDQPALRGTLRRVMVGLADKLVRAGVASEIEIPAA